MYFWGFSCDKKTAVKNIKKPFSFKKWSGSTFASIYKTKRLDWRLTCQMSMWQKLWRKGEQQKDEDKEVALCIL